MCTELKVSRSGYYAWRLGGPSDHAVADQGFTVMIKAIYDQGRGNPGVRRVRAGLAALGHLLSHKRVWRLMRAAGLQGSCCWPPRGGPTRRSPGSQAPQRIRGSTGTNTAIVYPSVACDLTTREAARTRDLREPRRASEEARRR